MPLDRALADHLAAIDGVDRVFKLSFDGPLLRRGNNRAARKRRRRREADLRQAMEAEMRERSRRAFRGPVSVTIGLFGREPNGPTSVKAYLDCMEGIFYSDDRMVEHLFVQTFSGSSSADEEKIYLEVEPLRVYAANFDHACHRLGPAFGEDRSLEFEEELEGDELIQLESELARETRVGTSPLDQIDLELAKMDRKYRRERIAELRLKQLLTRRLYSHDRPETPAASDLPRPGGTRNPLQAGSNAWGLPGSFWLPVPGGHGWREQVERELLAHMARWGVGELPISNSVGLDLAVHGLPPRGKDLDNLAHAVIGAFQKLVGSPNAEPLTSYRVYRRPGSRDGIRARLVDARLLEAVHREVFESHLKRLQPPRD